MADVSKKEDCISKTDFKKMINEASVVYVRKGGFKTADYVSYTKYLDMKARYDAWIKEKGTEPSCIYINKPAPASERKVGPVQKYLETGTGIQFNSITEFYNKIIKPYGKYSDPIYWDDKKTSKQTADAVIANVKGKTVGFINQFQCVDISQLIDLLAKEMGYTSTLWSFRCIQDQVNHAVALIDGKEFKGKTTVIKGKIYPGIIVDGAAAAESDYAIGKYWCNAGHERVQKEPAWLPYEKWM
ncbi:MAG: hypothetical protein FGO69_10950 [Methanobacterium sp.]|nr:MAG: hypothetical protein FGO69_10950 [Methanobacterium sp.]